MGIPSVLVLAFFLSTAGVRAEEPETDPLDSELTQMREHQDAEQERLEQLDEQLPALTQKQFDEYAVKYGRQLGADLKGVLEASDEEQRSVRVDKAVQRFERIVLLAHHLDPDAQTRKRMREHVAQVEKARRPVKLLFAAANLVNLASDLIAGGARAIADPVGLIDDVKELKGLEPYAPDSWETYFSQEFVSTVLREAGIVQGRVRIPTGIEGALKARETLSGLLGASGCNLLLSSG